MNEGKEKALSLKVLADWIKANTTGLYSRFFALSIANLGGNYQ